MSGGLVLIALSFVLACQPAAARQPHTSVIAPLAVSSLLLDAEFSGENIVAVGERGHVLRSEDRGSTWRQVSAPTRTTLTAVSFRDADQGITVGHDATILRTLDGGRTWQQVHYEPEQERPLLDVFIHDALHATAVGAYGYFLESRDGGATWASRELTAMEFGRDSASDDAGERYAEDFHFNHFAVSDTGKWYMAAEAGNIFRSDDRGETWQRMPSPYEGSFMGLLPLTDDRLLVFGLQGNLFYSGDAGATWHGLDTGTRATLTNARVLADGRVLLAGYSGALLTVDQGLTGIRLTQLEQRMGISSTLQLQNGDLMLFGTGGVLRLPLSSLRD